jgi:hypothetical protein
MFKVLILTNIIFPFYKPKGFINRYFWYDFRSKMYEMNKLTGIVFALIFLASCTPKKNTPDPVPVTKDTGAVIFFFKHNIDGEALVFDAFNYTNEAGNEYKINTLKYFISKITLHKTSGGEYDVNMYKLVNASETNADAQKYILQNVPSGDYSMISFIYGIDTNRNVFAGLENNPSNNSMEWPEPIGGGYHFMQLEGGYKKTIDTIRYYAIHLGKTPNQVYFEFPENFSVNKDTLEFDIRMNVNNWFKSPNMIDLRDNYGYIMEDDAKQLEFRQNAANVFSLERVN